MRLRAFLPIAVAPFAVLMAATCGDDVTGPSTCIEGRTLAIGAVTNEEFGEGDCDVNGDTRDVYKIAITTATVLKITASAAPVIMQITSDAAVSPGETLITTHGGDAGKLTFYSLLMPGNYTLMTWPLNDKPGTYSLTTVAYTPPQPIGCIDGGGINGRFYIQRGANFSAALSANDCQASIPAVPFDAYEMNMIAGKSYKFTIVTTAGMIASLFKDGVAAIPSQTTAAAGTIIINFTPTATGMYGITLLGTTPTAVGSYTFKLE